MADTSTKTKVQGGALLDALSKLLFKGIDKIFDAASEYQKEYGVLKQVTKIPVEDRKGNKYTLIVKLSPIKDREGLYYVEFACPDYSKFHADDFDKKVVKLNKDNKDDFKTVVNSIMLRNHLKATSSEDSSKKSEFDGMGDTEEPHVFQFYSLEDDSDCEVSVDVFITADKSAFRVIAEGDPELASPFDQSFSIDDLDESVGDDLNNHLEKKCKLTPSGEYSAIWRKFVKWLNNLTKEDADADDVEEESEEENTEASIKVTLEKVTADGHEDINLVSISCAEKINIIQDIVASDEFVDSMPEGESSYQIIEEDDDYDITQI